MVDVFGITESVDAEVVVDIVVEVCLALDIPLSYSRLVADDAPGLILATGRVGGIDHSVATLAQPCLVGVVLPKLTGGTALGYADSHGVDETLKRCPWLILPAHGAWS